MSNNEPKKLLMPKSYTLSSEGNTISNHVERSLLIQGRVYRGETENVILTLPVYEVPDPLMEKLKRKLLLLRLQKLN